MNLFDCFSRLQLEFTDDPAVLEGEGGDDEAEVEEKHWQTKQFGHLPPRTEDAEENEEQHWEKQNDGATQPLAGNLDRGLIENAVEKPWDGQPEKSNPQTPSPDPLLNFLRYARPIFKEKR